MDYDKKLEELKEMLTDNPILGDLELGEVWEEDFKNSDEEDIGEYKIELKIGSYDTMANSLALIGGVINYLNEWEHTDSSGMNSIDLKEDEDKYSIIIYILTK